MKKKFIFLFFIFLILIFVNSLVAKSDIEVSKVKIDSAIYEKFEQEDKVKVFISLKKEYSEKPFQIKIKEKIGKKGIKLLQDGMISDLAVVPENKFKIRHKFDSSFSAEISREVLEQLKTDSRVRSIEEVGIVHAFLTESTSLINSTLVWSFQVFGSNITGESETICILDTGVDYSHPDLGGCFGNGTNFSCKVIDGYDYVNNDDNPMDDNGHGTHVVGIAAANGSSVGVALGARIVAIKVLDSDGSGYTDDIKAGIDWCVNNASLYNISVISMSLGCGSYSDYCDSQSGCSNSEISTSIGNAISMNITVVAATGNDADTTSIASPACIKNATAVGDVYDADVGNVTWIGTCNDSTTSADKIVCHCNRNNITDLFAPGAMINSAWLGGGYFEGGGTSMATPHVAGAIAVINQFLKLTRQTKTPMEIESTLNATGKLIDDSSGSGLNFSRINLHAAILFMDNIAPNISLVSPADNDTSQSKTITFKCNATDWQLSNVTLYLWNSTNMYNKTTVNVSGIFNETEFNITDIAVGTYEWNCLAADEEGNSAFASSNFTFTKNLSISLDSPQNNSFVNEQTQEFTCSAETLSNFNLTNTTLYLWDSIGELHQNITENISGLLNTTVFERTLTDGVYYWNCEVCNNASQCIFAEENYTITFDTISPVVDLVSPVTSYTSSNSVTFTYTVTDTNTVSNCSLIINGEINSTSTSTTQQTITLPNADYNWSVNCTDNFNNMGNSTTKELTVSYTAPPPADDTPSSGGSSGGGGRKTTAKEYDVDFSGEGFQQETISGYAGTVKVLTFDGTTKHTIKIDSLKKTEATITISSSPIQVTIEVGEMKEIDLNGDGILDMSITLNSVKNGRASLVVGELEGAAIVAKEDSGEIIEEEVIEEPEEEIEEEPEVVEEEEKTEEVVEQGFLGWVGSRIKGVFTDDGLFHGAVIGIGNARISIRGIILMSIIAVGLVVGFVFLRRHRYYM